MRRREFIAGLAGATAARPLVARAQQREQMRRIGVVILYPENDPQGQLRATAFRGELEKAGWTIGGKVYLYSGTPFSVTDSNIGTDVNTSGVISPLADLLVSSETGAQCNKNTAIGVSCLSKADFATYPTALNVPATAGQPIQTGWGNIAGNSFRGPAYFDVDTQISRNFKIKERVTLNLGFMARPHSWHFGVFNGIGR